MGEKAESAVVTETERVGRWRKNTQQGPVRKRVLKLSPGARGTKKREYPNFSDLQTTNPSHGPILSHPVQSTGCDAMQSTVCNSEAGPYDHLFFSG